MSGWWKSLMNSDPEGEDPEKKKKKVPDTLVEVICEGCTKPINIRVQEKHRLKGHAGKQCHNCLHIIDVYVFTGGQITVFQSKQDGSNRHQTVYEKVWQDD